MRVGPSFETLARPRRRAMVAEGSGLLRARVDAVRSSPLAACTALDMFEVQAGDGHYPAAAAHDPRNGETHWPAGRFFAPHLKGQSRFPLTLADLSARKREHDARARKRPRVAQLRPGAGPGRRGLWVWDQAGVDLAFWQDRKASGRYFLSRRKAGMCLELEQERSL